MDVRETMRRDVPVASQVVELLDNLTRLVGRATPGVVVTEYAEIKRCAARHRDGPLGDGHRLGQSSLQSAAHAFHVNRENEVGVDFKTLLAFRDRLLIAPRQV